MGINMRVSCVIQNKCNTLNYLQKTLLINEVDEEGWRGKQLSYFYALTAAYIQEQVINSAYIILINILIRNKDFFCLEITS